MQIPSNLERFVSEIRVKLGELHARLTLDDVVRWALQFDQADQGLALQLFLKLRYFTAGDVSELCKVLFAQLPPKVKANLDSTLFVGLGTPADSGSMLAYHYRVNNNLPDTSFLAMDALHDRLRPHDESRNRRWHLVFIDDFIGTGGQATEILSRELEELLAAGSFDYIGFHALVGFHDGVKHIKAATSLDVCVAHMLTNKDRVFHEASDMLTKDHYSRERLKVAVERYGKRLYPSGPLGYAGTQALIAFFYNTPNNTLPVIWGSTDGWKPLLPRLDAEAVYEASEHEKMALTYLASIGGQSPVQEILKVGIGLDIPMESTIEALRKRHIVRVIDDDVAQYLELTAKGERKALALFGEEKSQSQERLRRCGQQFHNTLPEKPRSSKESFDQLRIRKSEVVALVSTACRLGDISTVRTLRGVASWLLLMDHAYEERIRLGMLILRSFDRETLGVDWGWTMVDDLGWSYVARGMLEEARQNIEEGIEGLWRSKDMLGVCQGWRHLQAIKVRNGDYVGARFGLRLVFGASCAIPHVEDRLEMQAGVLRALADACKRQGHADSSTKYRELSDLLSRRTGYQIHSSPDSRRMVLPRQELAAEPVSPMGEATLLLLRHPLTQKNQKRTFGRQLQAAVPEVGLSQIAELAGRVHAIIGVLGRSDARVYSAPAKSVRLLAQRVAEECGWEVKTEAALASIDAGELTGLSEEEAPEHFPDLMAKLKKYRKNQLDGFALEFPEGESFRDVTMRVARFLVQTAYAHGIPEVCVVVGHASSITAILNILEALDRLPKDSSHQYYDVPVASITKVSFDTLRGQIGIDPGESKTGSR